MKLTKLSFLFFEWLIGSINVRRILNGLPRDEAACLIGIHTYERI